MATSDWLSGVAVAISLGGIVLGRLDRRRDLARAKPELTLTWNWKRGGRGVWIGPPVGKPIGLRLGRYLGRGIGSLIDDRSIYGAAC